MGRVALVSILAKALLLDQDAVLTVELKGTGPEIANQETGRTNVTAVENEGI